MLGGRFFWRCVDPPQNKLFIKGLFFFADSFLIVSLVYRPDLSTMTFFDAHAFELLIALAMATASLVIARSLVVPVVRVVRVVVPRAPSRAKRR